MGAYCPTPLLDEPITSRIEREILVPIVDALRRDGIVYRGVLYAGLMLTHAGPKVLEFNCRFGDPECQPLMARLRGLDEAGRMPGVTVFHAGTRRETDGRIVTNGGRVVSVTALADSLRAARDLATEAAGLIRFEGAFFRRDIGCRVL
jgi:phosphoribosylamine--glycine ligase